MPIAQSATRSRIITVGGGKGGVGKSIVALNLAAALSQEGHRVVIADMDLGAANQHLLLGVLHPAVGLQDLLDRSVADAKDCLTETRVPGLKLLAGTSGVLGAANIKHAQKVSLLRKLRALDADIVVIDVGAGVGYNALDFFDLGACKLIVTTPQVTALHDAYAFLKSAVLRLLRANVKDAGEADLLEPATVSKSNDKVVDMLAHLRESWPELADQVFAELASFGACMVGNQVFNDAHAGVFAAVAHTMREYLGVKVPVLGWIPAAAIIHESVNKRRPLAIDPANKKVTVFRKLAQAVLTVLGSGDRDVGVVEEAAVDEPSAA